MVKNSLKEKKNDELSYDDESIFAEFNTFFTAGVDTTSTYLAMMVYLIAQHPDVEAKVRQ